LNIHFAVHYEVIPDGVSSIMQLKITSEFTIPTENAAKHAEEVAVQVVARLSGHGVDELRGAIQENLWMADTERPEEPSP
jgi:hypothetical protein